MTIRIRKKHIISLLASLVTGTSAVAQTIGGAVFGGGQNADVTGNTTVVVDKNAAGGDAGSEASLYNKIIKWEGSDDTVWSGLLDSNGCYDYEKYGCLYNTNGEEVTTLTYENDGANSLKPSDIPHATYLMVGKNSAPNTVVVHGRIVYDKVHGNSKNAWSDYLESGTDYYDYNRFGAIYDNDGVKLEKTYVDGDGKNCFDPTNGSLSSSADYQVLADVVCVAGGGEYGDVTGNALVEIYNGIYGYANDDIKKNVGSIIGGGLYGTVGTKAETAGKSYYPAKMPDVYRNDYENLKGTTLYPNYAAVLVDGCDVDVYGDVYGGGYGGVVLGSTFVRTETGYLRNVFGGGVQADVVGRTHLMLGSELTRVSSVHVSRFNRGKYANTQADDQADLRSIGDKYDASNLFSGDNVTAYGANTLIISGSAFGGGAYGQVGTSLSETDVKEMAAATITMNSGYIGYIPGLALHHASYEGNEKVRELCKNPFTLYQNKYIEKGGFLFGGGYGECTSVPNVKITVNSGFIASSVIGGGKKGDIGLVTVPASYFTDNSINMSDAATVDNYRRCASTKDDIIEIPVGTTPSESDGYTYFKKVFTDNFADGSDVSDVAIHGNSQYMVRHKDERVNAAYHVTRVDGDKQMVQADGLNAHPVNPHSATGEAIAEPNDRECGFKVEVKGSYFIYDAGAGKYVLVNDNEKGWMKDVVYGGKTYDAEQFLLRGKEGAADVELKPEDYYNLSSVMCVAGGCDEGDAYGNTNISIDGGSFGTVLEADEVFYGDVAGGCIQGFVNGNTNIKINGYTDIYGGVYGGGINGNVDGNTHVDIISGYMSNVYGGGKFGSVGYYLQANDEKHGNTFVTLSPDGTQDPHTKSYDKLFVTKNVYGGSEFGIVRTDSRVTMTGGRIGWMPDYDTHSRQNIDIQKGESDYMTSGKITEVSYTYGDGNVFGAGFGNTSTVLDNTYVNVMSKDKNHSVYVRGSVYGGGRQGCVGMGFVHVSQVVSQEMFDIIRNLSYNASPGKLYYFVDGQEYERGKTGYIPAASYQDGVDYYMAVKHIAEGDDLQTWGDKYGNTNVTVAANDGNSSEDGMVYIGGAVIGGSRGYNTIYEGNRKYTATENMYLGYVLNNTNVKVGCGAEKSESSITVKGSHYFQAYKNAGDSTFTTLTAPGEYNNLYVQHSEWVFYPIFQQKLGVNYEYYTKAGSTYTPVANPDVASLGRGDYYMRDYLGDYLHINPDTTTTEKMQAAIKAMTIEGGCNYDTRIYVLDDIYCVVGGGEDGHVIGNTSVEVTNGTLGHQDENDRHIMGDAIAGGLNGHVMGYTRMKVNGDYAYVMGDCYGGGYNGEVNNTTKGVADVMETGVLDPDSAKIKDPVATELLFMKGMVRDVYGGSCYSDVKRGNTHVQIGEKPEGGKSEADHHVVIAQSVYGASCYADVNGESVVDMYNGIVGYSRARYISYYNEQYKDNDPNHYNDVLVKDTWLTKDNDGNDTDNYLNGNYWWYADFREGNVFGAGYGADSRTLKTTVNIYGGRIRNSVYGGGEMGDVGVGTGASESETGEVIPAGSGEYLSKEGADLSAGHYTLYNKEGDTYKKAAEGAYYLPVISSVSISGGLVGDCVFGGGKGVADGNDAGGVSADVYGSTKVDITGGEWIVRTNTHNLDTDPYLCNTYAAGRINANVYGDTFLNIEKTMCGGGTVSNSTSTSWLDLYSKWYSCKYCAYGGGYGKQTHVYGNTNVCMDIKSSVYEVNKANAAMKVSPFKWQSLFDIVGGGYEGEVDGSSYVTVDGNSFVRNVYGGGFFAKLGTEKAAGETAYTTSTNVTLKAGSFESVYGGGFLSDVHGETRLDYGVYGAPNDHLFTRFNVYGGTNVSGNIAGSNAVDFGSHINIYGGTIGNEEGYTFVRRDDYDNKLDVKNFYYKSIEEGNIKEDNYLPVRDAQGNYDANYFEQIITKITVDGVEKSDTVYHKKMNADGTPTDIGVFEKMKVGNVYGAGNGDYPGFYEDGILYQTTGHSYMGMKRPNVASAMINIAGTKEYPAVINGAVYGGGNASTVGFFSERKYTPNPYAEFIPDYNGHYPDFTLMQSKPGLVHINIGGNAKIKNLFLGSNGECLVNNISQHVFNTIQRDINGNVIKTEKYSGFVDPIEYSNYMKIACMSCVPKLTFNKPGENGKGVFEATQDAEHNNTADNITIGSFYVGGNVGSMIANSTFEYTLPEGVTITDKVVGGSNNANLNYTQFYSPNPVGSVFGTLSPDAVSIAPLGHSFSYEGGLNGGQRISFSPLLPLRTKVKLNLLCKYEPTVGEKTDDNGDKNKEYSGCMVYGGCYNSGSIFGNVEIFTNSDMLGSESAYPLVGSPGFFQKVVQLIGSAKDIDQQFSTIFGGGYGEDTEVTGNTTITLRADYDNKRFPVVNRIFGGGDRGVVRGNTNVTIDAGMFGAAFGKVYGGGFYGLTGGNTELHLHSGSLVGGTYAGARMADVGGSSFVEVRDSNKVGAIILESLYGGCDIAGEVKGKKEFTTHDGDKVTVNSFISVLEDDKPAGRTGFPFIGHLYGGSDGHYATIKNGRYTENFTNAIYGNHLTLKDMKAPRAATAYIDITGGTLGNVYGGGNNVSVDGETTINFDNRTNTVAMFKEEFLRQTFMYMIKNHVNLYTGYEDKGDSIVLAHQVSCMYGGNNTAPMYIQPKWKLQSGTIGDLYSGGNRGEMFYSDMKENTETATGTPGIELTIDSPDMYVNNVYGGCRMADVRPYAIERKTGIDSEETFQAAMSGDEGIYVIEDGIYTQCVDEHYVEGKEYYVWKPADAFVENKYGAVLNIINGQIEHVYGGNDVSGSIYDGTNVNISGAISGNVYGAGNGNYLYQCDKDVTKITEVDHPDDKELPDLFFSIPFSGTTDAEKIAAVNAIRPNVSKSYLNVEGKDGRIAYVKGNLYNGGNASTILSNAPGVKATSLFNIGSNVTVNGVYLGSDGDALVNGTTINNFKKINGINTLSAPLTKDDVDKYGLGFYENPTLLTLYMKAVETNAMPEDFKLSDDLVNANIGTFCCGGNRGSVVAQKPVLITFPSSVNIFSRIIGGCSNANFTFDGVTHKGGFVAPNEDRNVDKIHFVINSHFMPKKMEVKPETADAGYLVDNTTEDGLYGETCNVYGGCYISGSVYGKVAIDMHSNLLEYADLGILDKTNKKEIPAFSVFGGGYGTSSWNIGGVSLSMNYDETVANAVRTEAPIKTAPVVNNFFGGGQLGNVIGNATLEITSGQVYNDVCGGSLAGYLYGSTQILVGYPQYYVCNETGYYYMKRGDNSQDNLNLMNEVISRDASGKIIKEKSTVLRTQIRYVKGDIVPANIYQMIKDYDDANGGSQHDKFTLNENTHDTWTDNDNIWLRKGVYGGGYAHVSGNNVYAGSFTVCKYTDEYNLSKLSKEAGTTDDEQTQDNAFVENLDYGGNTCILVSDDRSADSDHDHITISSEVHREVKMSADDDVMGYYVLGADTPSANKYTHQHTGKAVEGTTYYTFDGDGGIYGDGRMVFAEGIRAVDIYNYGYASYTPQYPKLLNTFQRCDIVSVTDCCMQLQGAQDFATNSVDATTYAITRINELRLNSTIDGNNAKLQEHTGNNDVLDVKKSRNYMGLFHNIHYLGSVVSNASFDDTWHDDKGNLDAGGKTYRQHKQDIIEAYVAVKDDENKGSDVYETFKKRNVGTSKNLIGINNGYCLKIQNCYTTVDDGNHVVDHIYYGPVEGVVEVRLLTLIPGEGGGYIYADNVHDDPTKFLNTSGNFVFPGMAHTEGIAPQHIVDDCFPTGFYNTKGVDAPKEDVHYWYVEGNLYFYSSTITGYTYTSPTGSKNLNFDMNNVDQIITLSGTSPKPNKVVLKSVKWHSEHDTSEGYECDLENTERPGYKLMMTVSTNPTYDPQEVSEGKICYFESIPRTTNNHPYDLSKDKITDATDYVAEFTNKDKIADYSPLLAIRLNDTQNDNGGRDYYEKHMNQPDYVQLILQSEVHDPDYPDDETKTLVYTYVVNLTIKYVLGPMVTGSLDVKNCALPGEIIHVSKTGVTVDADESMPVTNSYWKILPKVDDNNWTDVQGGEFVDQYVNPTTGDLELPALYMYNGAKVEYFIETSNYVFPVEAPRGDDLVVHNYHRMQKVASLDKDGNIAPQLDVIPGSRIYIQDKTDLERFRMYLDYCNGRQTTKTLYAAGDLKTTRDITVNPDNCQGLKFYMQDNIAADTWTVPATAFKGELNGDGYVIDLSKTAASSMLNANDGQVYNLGVVGTKMANTNSGLIMNSFSYGADIATSNRGMVANSYQNSKPTGGVGIYASTEKFNEGEVAYNLNKYYLDKRYLLKGAADTPCAAYEKSVDDDGNVTWNVKDDEDHAAYQYIYDYYKNGDYRYAKVHDAADVNNVYLRTMDVPNYNNGDGTYATYHNTQPTPDPERARFQSGSGDAATLTAEAEGNTFALNEPVYPKDYMFFGQKLVYGSSKSHNKYPVHLDTSADVDNRVYRASGFYGSKQDKGVHFNHAAAFNKAALTAIDLTCQRDNEATAKYVKGYRDASDAFKAEQDVFYAPTADYDGITAFSLMNDAMTRNLLVYTSNDETSKEYTLVDNATVSLSGRKQIVNYDKTTDEKNILAHHMVITTEGTTATKAKAKAARGLFHLVDKQDFNSPIAFGVDTRAWYERKPECFNEGHNDGWESICLPFTVKKVTAIQVDNLADGVNYFNHGEITHFFGSETDKDNYDTENPTDAAKYNTDHNQVGHEYWLRGFTDYVEAGNTLTFMRPTAQNGGGFFDQRIVDNKFSYVYDNKYLAGITDGKNGYSYYDVSHTYDGYMPLTADVPYILSYPGTYFYEFNMTGEKMTYENPSATIGVTDDGSQSSDYNGYEYFGTFRRLTPTAEKPLYFSGALAKKTYAGDCFMLSDVSQTDADGNVLGTVYPFRGYFKAAKASGAKQYLPFAGTRLADDKPSQPVEEEIGGLRIWVEKRTLCIDSPKDMMLNLYTVDGIFQRRLDVKEGSNRYDMETAGVYIVNGKKYFIR